MEAGILEAEKDVGKARFQQELNKWFESRGVIADLRSHLRHLMVTALQSTQMGTKPADGSSPKAQALNLLVAEYLFRRKCHYALSVFTSEVPTLANFSLDAGKSAGAGKKRPSRHRFREDEVEEIFNALGIPSHVEELKVLKRKYLEKDDDVSLVELFLQVTLQLATKLQIQQHFESYAVEGERVLSKEWSSKIVDVLLGEKMASSQISALEETIFRITENEMRRIVEEQRRLQMRALAMREKRIQEYLRKHEEEILLRLTEAEKELMVRKDAIEEELNEREKHLTKMAVEWNDKHEEILKLSKKFHNIENENRSYKKKLKEAEETKKNLKAEGEIQNRRIHELREELNSVLNKLKEVTDSNVILSERIQVLIEREAKEAFLRQEDANQPTARASVEIPLLWSKNTSVDAPDFPSKELEPKMRSQEFSVKLQKETAPRSEEWNDVDPNCCESSEETDSLSSSFVDIIQGVQKKLQVLEEESNRLNQNYLEYKLKCISVDSDSENFDNPSAKSESEIQDEACSTRTNYCQTYIDDTFVKMRKLKEAKVETYQFDDLTSKKSEISPRRTIAHTPNKRQLQNREYFLKNRQLVQQLEKQHEEVPTSSSIVESSTPTSAEELTVSPKETKRKSPIKSVPAVPLRTPRVCSDERAPLKDASATDCRRTLVESSNQFPKSDADCLALLEQTRIKSPQGSARRPLRQQMLLSESEKEEADEENREEEEKLIRKSSAESPPTNSSGKVCFDKNRGSVGF